MSRQRILQIVSWRGTWLLNRLQSPHVTVTALLALWALLTGTIDYPLFKETRRMAMQLASIPEPAPVGPAARKAEPRNLAKEFAATLPEFDAYPDQLRDLHALADKHGIVITRADYRYELLAELPIEKLAIHMDINGPDEAHRRFLQAMLNALSNLSIARLAYAKSTDGSTKVEQKLDIHLYYRVRAAA
ncbi:hypothetical protein [Burkholderia sp. BCC0405]|uniref:hypothetical protein n=1 Tax=Burkholderia sp. BCC0405 TaxID=2676298 RepID=UPI00158A78B2|nr:hypothetical protein [Burkholderia sp. BCC0405]